jgi:hypothetical protein
MRSAAVRNPKEIGGQRKMTTLDPHAAILMIICMAVGYVMMVAGLSKNALEWRKPRRVCPSCGHRTDSCLCR